MDKSGVHIDITSLENPRRPKVEDFERLELTQETLARAQQAVDSLRLFAECCHQYTDAFINGVVCRAYFGEAGEAIYEAEKIKQLVNTNLYTSYAYHLLDFRII